ncbi:MAG: hypothetical protein IE889_00475 [Campylobacterales bacterium]|nr:hypothetical protein [Campylobacterales bacterium]
MKKQLMIFLGIFLFLAIGMHFKEWFSHPIEHLTALPHAGAYGLGMIHPLIFTLAGYILFSVVMVVVKFIKKIVAG